MTNKLKPIGSNRVPTSTEKAIVAFWVVSHAINHPQGASVTTSDALKKLNLSEELCTPESWRIKARAHDLKFDIIEGSSVWRANPQAVQSGMGKQEKSLPKVISMLTHCTKR